jgi:ATP-dependent DNA ligase
MFTFIPPMQSARFTASHDIRKIFPDGFWVETKLDGWWIQVHKNGNEIRLFSRSGKDYTETFKSAVDAIKMDNVLTADTCIVDGEILGWNKTRLEYSSCSSLTTIAKETRNSTSGSTILVIRLWDVLQIDGDESVQGLSLEQRRQRLRMIVTNSDVLQVVEPHKLDGVCVLHTWDDAKQLLKDAMRRSEEGVVLKSPSSKYKPGSRSVSGGWFKLKPDYFERGTNDFDLLIVGARRSWGSSPFFHFLVALADPAPDQPTRFLTVSHVGGMTGVENRALGSVLSGCMVRVNFNKKADVRKFNTKAVTFTRKVGVTRHYILAKWASTAEHPAVQVIYSGTRDEFAEVVFDPRRSLIVTLRADYRLPPSVTFATNHTLRFPRLDGQKRIRIDRPDLGINGDPKPWTDCMCITEFEAIVEASLNGTTAFCFDFLQSKSKRVPVTRDVRPFREYCGSGAKQRSNMLRDYVIHIQRCSAENLKNLENISAELGAHVMAADPLSGKNPKTFPDKVVIIIGTATYTTSQAFVNCQRADRDVVDEQWLRDCHAREADDPTAKPPELQPKYMLNTSATLQEEFDQNFDKFGDSYTEPLASLEEFDNLLENGKGWDELSLNSDGDLSDGQVGAVEEDLLSDGEDLTWSVFKGVVAQLVPLDPSDTCELALARARLIAGGAAISPSVDHAYPVTHIVVVWAHARPPQQSPDWLSVERMTTVRASLPSQEPYASQEQPYTHKRRRTQALATDWVVVSTAWVKASM